MNPDMARRFRRSFERTVDRTETKCIRSVTMRTRRYRVIAEDREAWRTCQDDASTVADPAEQL